MIRILAAMLAASTLIFAHASAGPIKTYDVAGWTITVHADTANRFVSCVASGTYEAGQTLHFMIDADLQWYVAVDTPE